MDATQTVTFGGMILTSTVLVEWVKGWFSKRQIAANSLSTEAGASALLVKTVLEWATGLKSEVADLKKMVSERDGTILNLTAKVNRLELRLEVYEKNNVHPSS